MSASVDYTGRSVDLLIFQGVGEGGDHKVDTGFGDAGFVCTGVQKVAQSWLALFMTNAGSVLNKSTRGSSFLPAVRRGRIRVSADVPAEFAIAAAQVRRTMELDAANAETPLPDDERLDSAILIDYELVRELSHLRLKIRITSMAGNTRVVFLPVPVPIR